MELGDGDVAIEECRIEGGEIRAGVGIVIDARIDP